MSGSDEAIVINRLIRWGRWKGASGVSLGYKPRASFMALLPHCGIHDDAYDSECVQTNKAIESLPILHRELIRYEYYEAKTEDKQFRARYFGVCIRTYRQRLHEAHQKLARELNISLDMMPIYNDNVVNTKYCVQRKEEAIA